jgi:integrase
VAEPKTERSRRTITLPALVVQALEAHRKRQLETRLAAGRHWREHGLVFTSRIGTPTDGRNLHTEYKRILRATGLPNVRFHDLRHTAATLLLAQGVSPRTIMETLGHSQISLTLNTYSHVLPSLQQEAARKMDAILTGTES